MLRRNTFSSILKKSPDKTADARNPVNSAKKRRVTTSTMEDEQSQLRIGRDTIAPRKLSDTISHLFKHEPDPLFEANPSHEVLPSAPGYHNRGLRVKRFNRSVPSSFGVGSYSTALGPLQEKHQLQPLERVFLEAAEHGDKSTMVRCLNFKDGVNINCVNMLGRTAIQIAVDNENIELVELLLQQPGIKIGDALLYAIQEGVYRIVEMLIDHPSITKEMLGASWKSVRDNCHAGDEESHDFSSDISPVILAAVCNQFEILQLLLNRGAHIEEPHKTSCDCTKCLELLNADPLKHTLQRINTYRALASPAWISLTSPDPILTAFELSSELLHLASRENEFKETFISLCEQCRRYACDLLDLCRGTGEVVAVLSKSNSLSSDESQSSSSDEDAEPPESVMTQLGTSSKPAVGKFPASSPERHSSNRQTSMLLFDLDQEENELCDWREIVNRTSGSKRREPKTEQCWSHNFSSNNWSHSREQTGLSTSTTKETSSEISNRPRPVFCRTADCPDKSPHPSHTLEREGNRTTTTPDSHARFQGQSNRPRLNSEEVSPASSLDQRKSVLFSEPRRGSFDLETEIPLPVYSTVNEPGSCCYCYCCHGDKSKRNATASSDDQQPRGDRLCDQVPLITSFRLDRLKLAIKHEQKMFVAHPHCQHLLTTLWYDQLPGWRKRHPLTKFLFCFCFIFALPLMAPIFLVHPKGRVGQILRSPLIKFINHSASFALFIFLLLIASTDSDSQERLKLRSEVRGPAPNKIEVFILWWVIGFVWSEMKQIWEEGFKAYVHQWWNWLDFIMLGLYLTTVALRLVAMMLRLTGKYGDEATPRKKWPTDDPTLLSEALFSIAHIFSFARIIFLFQVNEHLGPLQISLGNMLIDITKFIFIFLLVISSFACGLHQLYYYYVSDEQDYRPEAFKSLVSSYRTLFWHLFGTSQVNHFEVNFVDPKTERKQRMPSARNTEIVGEILLLIYHAMAIIVLVNMLIAMMSNSFQTIQNHADTEWKFARSKLWVGYFDEGSTLPPPLNTMVSPKSVYRAIKQILRLLAACFRACRRNSSLSSSSKSRQTTSPIGHHLDDHMEVKSRIGNQSALIGNKVEAVTSNQPLQQSPSNQGACNNTMTRRRHTFYQMVMRRLVRRYIHQSRKTMRQDGVSEDDLLEIKQDISSLRYELREDRKREVARTIGHLEGLKREIVSELRSQFQSCGGVKSVAPDPTSKHEGASPAIPPECLTETVDDRPKHTRSKTGDQKTFKQSELLSRPQSLACGQETQCIYDEIKQLALINTAYERSRQIVLPSQALSVSTYTNLKDEIILGVKNELVGVIKQLCEVSNASMPSNCSDSSEPKGTVRPPPIASTSRLVLKHEMTPRVDAPFSTNLSSRPRPLRSAFSVTQPPRLAEVGGQLENKQTSRAVSRQMSSHYLGSSTGTFICPIRESASLPLRPVYHRGYPPLNEGDSDYGIHRLEKKEGKSVR